MIEKYKTIHENAVMINPPKEEEEFFIFNATHIDGRLLTQEELEEIKKTKEGFYKNFTAKKV